MYHLIYSKFLTLYQGQQKAYELCKRALNKFQRDRCASHSNAIAYAVVISIIPLLTIFVQLAKVQRKVVQSSIASFLSAYGLSDTTELLVILDDILSRAETIAGVGFVFVLYAATNFFRNLEDAFNHIYSVQKKRPLLYRFSLYISAFVILPIVVIFASQIFQSIRYYFQAPEIRQILLHKGQEWLITSNGNIEIYSQNKKQHRIDLRKKADFQAPYREIFIDTKDKESGHPWEVMKGPAYSYQPNSHERYKLLGAVQTSSTVYVISEGASLFYSKDKGQSWQYQQIILHSDKDNYVPYVKDIHMNKAGQLMLLVDETGNSAILTREKERQWRYQPLEAVYKRFISIDNISSLAHKSSRFRNGLYLCGKGNYLYSAKQGLDWQGPFEEKYGDRKVQITAMQADENGNMYFGGYRGAFWIHGPSETFYPDLRTRFEQDVKNFVMYKDASMFLYGSGGLFRYSEDWGHTWHRNKQNVFTQTNLLSESRTPLAKGKELYFTGSENTLILAKAPRLTKELDSSGRPFVSIDYKILSHASFWSSFLSGFLLEPLFLILVFVLLWLLYILLPNIKVDYKAACIGAALSSLSLVLFLFSFRIWISNSTTTGYIYGVWAAIPLGMLIILVSSYILLFGLELSFVIQEDRKNHKQAST